jgi:predicted AlkP superfamily pyrophosphatase or phosphodiesterase
MKKILCLFLCTVFSSFAAPQAGHVVLISVDGLRPDGIEEAGAPAMLGLKERGLYCPKAKTTRPSLTIPGHASMMTGLEASRHRATWYDYTPEEIAQPTLFSVVKKTGKGAIALLSKPKLYFLVPEKSVDFRYLPPVPEHWDSPDVSLVRAGIKKSYAGPPDTTAATIAKVFAAEWPKRKPAFAFVHFRETDAAGHKYGWMSEEYLEAVRVCDRAIGSVLQTIEHSGFGAATVVIVTSDHGGEDNRHDLDIPENNTIPWMAAGPGVPAGLRVEREIRVTDTMPTVLKLLGIPVPEKLDGKPVDEVCSKPDIGQH